jgi:hypothetical protein
MMSDKFVSSSNVDFEGLVKYSLTAADRERNLLNQRAELRAALQAMLDMLPIPAVEMGDDANNPFSLPPAVVLARSVLKNTEEL